MTRVLSALALLPIVVGIIWFLAPIWTLVLVEAILVLALLEYAKLVSHVGCPIFRAPTVIGAIVTCAAVALAPMALPAVLMLSFTLVGGSELIRGRRPGLLSSVAASVMAVVYLAIPCGAVVALGYANGRETVLMFVLTVMASDTVQYYGGRAFGRRRLAPSLSPGKTVEGALSGVVAATVVMLVVGEWWFTSMHPAGRALLGLTMAVFGIAGDLFESGLKRAASLKDASALIPGHGGVLDRIDAFIFAVPVYYVAVLWFL